ncbi:MAG: FkbM family methyltransferase, partial [bacterium]
EIGELFERIIQSFYSKVVRTGDTIIDGGAHTGRHTIPLAHLIGDNGVIVAFEPLPSAAEKLRQLLAHSGLDQRVRLRTEALGHERGSRPFFVVNNMPEFSGLRSRQYIGFVPDQSEIKVNVETIDSVMDTNLYAGPLSFVKLDLEGEEFSTLRGGENTLRACRPCCVFENGLKSSASDYGAEEFFGYFRDLDYELYDILGCWLDETRWSQAGPWYFVAIPKADSRGLLPLLWALALEELLATPWLPPGLLRPPPASFSSRAGFGATGVMGHVDHIETVIRVRGWAGDLQSDGPARSLVITVDGVAIGAFSPAKPRNDVVVATERVGFAYSGWEVAVRAAAGRRVEIHAEAADGTFVKLGGTES